MFTHLQNLSGHIQLFSDPLWEERKKYHFPPTDSRGLPGLSRIQTVLAAFHHCPVGPSSNKSTRSCACLLSLPINRFKVYSGGFWNYFLHFAGIIWRISHLSPLYLNSLPSNFSVTFSSFLSPLVCSRLLSLL